MRPLTSIGWLLLVTLLQIGQCSAAPFLSFLLGSKDDRGGNNMNRRVDLKKGKGSKKPVEYDTYYVPIPSNVYRYDPRHVYDHAEGVVVWELPTIWDGSINVPNIVPDSVLDPKEPYDESKEDSDRVVKGWDNRWGIRVAIPYFGDFQYLRELGPGDFVPKLGPGKFEYPGPGEIDDPGHAGYAKYPELKQPKPHVPLIDLSEYQDLGNYPWYSR